MNRLSLISVMLLLIGVAGTASAEKVEYTYSTDGLGVFTSSGTDQWILIETEYNNDAGATLYADVYVSGYAMSADGEDYAWTDHGFRVVDAMGSPYVFCNHCYGHQSFSYTGISVPNGDYISAYMKTYTGGGGGTVSGATTIIISDASTAHYTVSGVFECIDTASLYILDSQSNYIIINTTNTSPYSFPITDGHSYRIIFDGAYYDFTCDGDEVFDYDACIWVYGYTCGVDNIKLYKDDGGWVLDDTESQGTGYDVYEMQIVDGEDYKISFIDSGTVVYNQTFSCTGDHVLIDFDRCSWVYPPNGPPVPIYLWTGYDYNIVVFKDAHGNLIENSQIAIYDNTDNQYLHRWTDAVDGYTLLGARFAADHDVRVMLRTFDGVFTLDTTCPANGSAPVGDEAITTTNWTIPIKYNLNVLPVDKYGIALFDVFCGLSEYTPLNPQAFWGMDLSDRGYVPVTNCSGFAMCDIIAEKEGYADYRVEALNWTSKSALVKDYRHNVVMEEE